MKLFEKIARVQQSLRAPKDLRNDFGKYNYRSCESILEAVKPLLSSNNLALFLGDEIKEVSGRFYVEATATVVDTEDGEKYSVKAFAREEESKKGMDGSQVTGASSSYARKYALNGLFAIDDNKDSDATNVGDGEPKKATPKVSPTEKYLKKEGDVTYAVCDNCGNYIYDWKRKNGEVMPVKDFVTNSINEFGKCLCRDCIKAESAK